MAANSPVRTIALLSISQALGGSNGAIVVAIGGLAAATLAPDRSLATLPVTAMVIGLALTSGLASYLIHRLGRRNGFMLGAALSLPAGLIAATAIMMHSFVLFCAALFLVGVSNAFGNQYRFAAADSVPSDWKGKAISFVLLGGVFAGFVGPGLSGLTKDIIPGAPFAGSFLIMAALAVVTTTVLSQTRLAPNVVKVKGEEGRSIRQLLREPDVLIPIIAATTSYALMTLVMVAAPLAMVYVCGLASIEATTAIQWHVVAMYAPSFVTGWVIGKLGAHLTAGLGLAMIAAGAIVALTGTTVLHFDAALILLGAGWNFGFIGSTALLAASYSPQEAARVQGLNEQLVFGVMAVASISSGLLLQLVGWQTINIIAIPLAAAAILMLAWGDLRQRSKAAAA
jgi:MFS family permease